MMSSLRVIVLLLLPLLLLPSTLAAATSTKTSKHRNNNNNTKTTCPSACNVATLQTELDNLKSFLQTKRAFIVGKATIGGPYRCNELLSAETFDSFCSQPASDPPSVAIVTTCPDNYALAIQTNCWGRAVDSQGHSLKELLVIDSGAIAGTAFCQLATQGLEPGIRVEILQTVTCTYYTASSGGLVATSADDDDVKRAMALKSSQGA